MATGSDGNRDEVQGTGEAQAHSMCSGEAHDEAFDPQQQLELKPASCGHPQGEDDCANPILQVAQRAGCVPMCTSEGERKKCTRFTVDAHFRRARSKRTTVAAGAAAKNACRILRRWASSSCAAAAILRIATGFARRRDGRTFEAEEEENEEKEQQQQQNKNKKEKLLLLLVPFAEGASQPTTTCE
jgi:hypothetical protein